jgi:hypothetical protein
VLQVLQVLTSDPANEVWVISGRSQQELGAWFESVVSDKGGSSRGTGCCCCWVVLLTNWRHARGLWFKSCDVLPA